MMLLQHVQRRALRCATIGAAMLVAGCGQHTAAPATARTVVPVSVESRALRQPTQACTNSFVTHELDHRTTIATTPVDSLAGNGAGLAVGDLNGDGLPEIVLANLDGPNTILWNEGQLHFRTEQLAQGDSRAAALVDVDGDGRLDIVFTRRHNGPLALRNVDGTHFTAMNLGIAVPLYSMNWGDVDGDGMLDLVGGTYDAELQQQQGIDFLTRHDGGVYLYHHTGNTFENRRLSEQAQALAIALPDLNNDGKPDILVGNDFAMRDAAWLNTGNGWSTVQPFDFTSENTMSFDQGDIDNSGRMAVFATDMKPYDKSTPILAQWLPMMKKMETPPTSNDPQIVENTLQVPNANGRYQNQGYERMVDATGWSWSGKFGDLDNDGQLDLYVVNGMISHGLFSHLPHDALVERNQALRNQNGMFHPAKEWKLDSTASGRGMSMADLDGDGDLDIVVNNVGSPAQLFENQLCGGAGLEVDLRMPHGNTHALGARLALHTSAGTFTRDVRAMSGYLSGDSAQVHFGVPRGASIEQLEVTWPDGTMSTVTAPAVATALTLTRS